MLVIKALNTIIAHSGKAKEQISREMGRNPNFLGVTTSRGSIPRTDTFCTIADTCGYDLLLVKRDGTETIHLEASRE